MQITTHTVGHGVTLTAYVQEPSPELTNATIRPAVLVLPGGGYFVTSDREAEPIALAYLAEGFNAFVLRYSTGPDAPFTQSFDDAKAALAWIREHAASVHTDPRKVAAVGFSAGGHLAASLATAADDKPDALVVGYPVTLAEFGPPIGKDIIDVPSHVTSATPPTFLFSTCDDVVVPIRNSVEFISALAKHSVPFESHIYLLGPHGLSLSTAVTANSNADLVHDPVARWLSDSVRFLWSVFGPLATSGSAESYETLLRRRVVGLDMPVGRLLEHDGAAAALAEHAPAVVHQAGRDMLVTFFTLRQLGEQNPELLPADTLATLERELGALG